MKWSRSHKPGTQFPCASRVQRGWRGAQIFHTQAQGSPAHNQQQRFLTIHIPRKSSSSHGFCRCRSPASTASPPHSHVHTTLKSHTGFLGNWHPHT